jgi:hypothetical protein
VFWCLPPSCQTRFQTIPGICRRERTREDGNQDEAEDDGDGCLAGEGVARALVMGFQFGGLLRWALVLGVRRDGRWMGSLLAGSGEDDDMVKTRISQGNHSHMLIYYSGCWTWGWWPERAIPSKTIPWPQTIQVVPPHIWLWGRVLGATMKAIG